MKTIVNTLLVCFCIGLSGNLHAQSVNLLPEPVKLVMKSGSFRLDADVEIVADKATQQQVTFLSQIIQDKAKISLPVVKKASKGKRAIRLEVTKKSALQKEGYLLHVTAQSVTITAATEVGVFYGIQSLRQLISDDISVGIPCLEIEDYPQFAWRAFMLDDSRHFLGKAVVLKLLDNMSSLKMNVFHWHLVDGQGWRIEIKKYPELTKKGASRDNSSSNKPSPIFYTQEEIKEIVAYASARHITIVPEIEIPGHSDAAIASYPWLGSKGVLNLTNPAVEDFIKDVLEEIIALFPGNVVHIGGDEVDYKYWKNTPSIVQYMQENDILSPADLQVSFTNRIAHWLASKNRRIMGWNEVLGKVIPDYWRPMLPEDHIIKQPLASNAIVHCWEGNVDLIRETIQDGYDIVNSFHLMTYLDLLGDNYIPLEKAYSFQPIPEGLTAAQQKKVLGLGCQMWTEQVPDEKNMNTKVYPRLAAYAETGWTSPDKKDYNRFLKSLDYFLNEWKKQGIEYGVVQPFTAPDWGEKRWQDLPENPLIDPVIYGLPECVIGDPQILTPGKFDDKWHAFFHGFSHDTRWHTWFFHSVSNDGLHWTLVSKEEGEVGIQYIFNDGDRWIQYYTASTNYMEDKEIAKKCNTVVRARTTTDFVSWSKPVTLVIPELPKEREGPSIEARNPCVIQLPDGRYRLYYSGGTVYLKDAGYPEPKYIFCAEADNALGPFVKREEPVLVPDTNLPFRNFGCGGFKAFGYKNGYLAFYNPIYLDAEGKSRSEIRILFSEDGLKWKEADCNPVVKPEPNIPWRSAIIYQLDVVPWKNTLLMYFNAREGWRGGAERIGAVRLDLNGDTPVVKLEK